MSIILASNSPRRRELLAQIGIRDFQILSPDVDEAVEPGLSPARMVEALSLRKAQAAAGRAGANDLIIAADTVVALEGQTLGKPQDKADAKRMLSLLSGNHHQVYTGFTVRRGEQIITRSECTQVKFRTLEPREIEAYIASGEPMDKAGAYGIQALGGLLVEGIRGDYFNVMGLPVCALGETLKEFGIRCL